jgi:hypothetical protein
MDNYKATPEQWKQLEEWSRYPSSSVSCILELRARVEVLEAQAGNLKGSLTSSTPPPVATDEELYKLWHTADTSLAGSLRAIYNLGIKHGQARSREVAEPAPVAGGLVERVSDAITSETGSRWASTEARAAILEVAAWMRENECGYNAVRWLEQEADQ